MSENCLMSLLKAYPQGAKMMNTAKMIPLQIAIKAQAKIEWLQALLASYPESVLAKVSSGENAVELAIKVHLPNRSIKLLEEMYNHVCQQNGYTNEEIVFDTRGSGSRPGSQEGVAVAAAAGRMSSDTNKISVSGIRAVDASSIESVQQRYISETNSTGSGNRSRASSAMMEKKSKARALSDNDFTTFPNESFNTRNLPDGRNIPGGSLPRQVSENSSGVPPTTVGTFSGQTSNVNGDFNVHQAVPFHNSTQLRGRKIVSLPPRWTNASNCHICSVKFGTFKKRHHCRNCGQSICGDHSARQKIQLLHYGLQDRHRVCTVCYELLRNTGRRMMQAAQARGRQSQFPSQSQVPPPGPVRRSDEAIRDSPPSGTYLERHVSAPARPMETNYSGIHAQVADLQKQVNRLMEEKQMAENALRIQTELLGEALGSDMDRLTVMDRLNKLRGSNSPNNPAVNEGFTPLDRNTTVRNTSKGGTRYAGREVDIDAGTSSLPVSNRYTSNTRYAPPIQTIKSGKHYTTEDLESVLDFHDLSPREESTLGTEDTFAEEEDEEEDKEDGQEEEEEEEEEEEGTGAILPEVDVLVNLGTNMLVKGSSSAAVAAFERAVEICPNEALLFSYLGKAYYADDQLDKAVEALNKSLAIEPSATNSTLLGKILFEKGDHDKAIEAYQKSLEIQQARE
jgi:hypothetical protein